MSDDSLRKVRAILETMLRDELLPARAAAQIANLTEATTPEELGMDSLARFALMGELRKAFGKKVDAIAVSGANSLGELLRAVKSGP
jgi:acyl carrier protein